MTSLLEVTYYYYLYLHAKLKYGLLTEPVQIYLSSPHMGGTEKKFVEEAFETNWIAPLGPNVTNFEKEIQAYYDQQVHCAALSSGTAALHLALILNGVGPGDEVLCQSFTFAASANPVVYQGAQPIFIDSEEETWNISPELLEKAIKDSINRNKLPKAIVAVDLYGMPFKADEILSIAERYGISVIEDSAEALGSTWHGKKCGTLTDCGILSFNGNKIITTSGGGAFLSKDPQMVAKAVHLATQARDNASHYQHTSIGFNYRMSNVLAGIGRGQLEVLEKRVTARRNNYDFYVRELGGLDNIGFLKEPEGFRSNRWITCIVTDSFETREKIRKDLLAHRIESRPLWKPMHLQPVFNESISYSNGVSEDLFTKGLCLPSGSDLTLEQLKMITDIIKKSVGS